MRSWNGAVKPVVRAPARSTCSSPSTSRRTVMPCCRRSASSTDSGPILGETVVPGGETVVRGQRRVGELPGRAQVAGRIQGRVDLLGGDPGPVQLLGGPGQAEQGVPQR